MATIRLIDLPALVAPTGVLSSDAILVASGAAGQERKATVATVLGCLGVRVVVLAALPTGNVGIIFVSNGRKVGEGAAAGTGVLCTWNGSNWVTTDAGTIVAA